MIVYADPAWNSSIDEPKAGTASHETQHLYQHNWLGPFYVPAHLASMAFSYAVTGTYNEANALEIGPYDQEQQRPWL